MKIITVGGVSGVGKTTFIKELANKLVANNKKVKIMFELKEKDNSFDIFRNEKSINDEMFDTTLELFVKNYHDIENKNDSIEVQHKLLFHEILFLTNRASKSIKAIKKAKLLELDYLIIDRTIIENKVFGITTVGKFKDLFEEFNIIWTSWIDIFKSEVELHDSMHIILSAKTENVVNRIKNRGREYEQGKENEKYFSYLNDLYQDNIENAFISSGFNNYRIISTDNKTPLDVVLKVLHNF